MKFDQITSYNKRKKFIEKLYQKCDLETGSRSFYVYEEFSKTSIEKNFFKTSQSYWICNNKTTKICQSQCADFLKFLFPEDFF